jgi:hypothetical protein
VTTIECYDCHQQVRDLRKHRGVCSRGRHGKSGTVECYDCHQQVVSLHEHRANGQCPNPRVPGQRKNQAHAVVAATGNVTPVVPLPGRDVYVLVDLSGSMAGAKLDQAKLALAAVHVQMADDDRLSIITFDARAFFRLKQRANGQVRRQNELPALLDRMRAQGSTALYDAIYMAVEQMRGARGSETRIVVLTDGEDNASQRTLAEVTAYVDQYPALTLDILHIDGKTPVPAFIELIRQGRGDGEYTTVTVETIVKVTVERACDACASIRKTKSAVAHRLSSRRPWRASAAALTACIDQHDSRQRHGHDASLGGRLQ